MGTRIRLFALVVMVASSSFLSTASAADSAAPVSDALAKLEAWLGTSANGRGWSAYLKLPTLHAQLAAGDKANPADVDAVLAQLKSGAPGLDLGEFENLRIALANWSAELVIAKSGGLTEAILGAESTYHAIGPDDIAAARKSLDAAVAKLDKYLVAAGANGTAWKSYLKWNDLTSQLQATPPNSDALKTVAGQYSTDNVGLELPVFADVGTALQRYINALEANKEDVQAQFKAQLTSLANELKQYMPNYSDEMSNTVGGRLGWLERMRQALPLVNAVRTKYSTPNLNAKVSARLVAAGIAQEVDDVSAVRDNILGTSISGTGHTKGQLAVALIPSSDRAILETRLIGTTATRTVGYNGPATIHANGTTQIAGNKRITIDATGLRGEPAKATANTKTQITGVSAGGRLANRIANDRVAEKKGQAEAVGSQHAAARVRERVESQAGPQLSKAQADFLQKFRNPLVRRGAFPSLLHFSTTEDFLFVKALEADLNQLGAPTQAPPVQVASDLAVQVHESMINNGATSLFAGTTLTEEGLQKWVIETRGSLPDQLKSDEDRDPWSITFARTRPVTMKMIEDGFQITIRGQRYTSGERQFQAMNVTAVYKMQIDGPGSKLVRQGELDIMPPGFVEGGRLTTQQVTLKTLLQKKFNKLFEPEIKNAGLILPGKWRNAGRLDLKQLQSKDGWLVAAWIESGVPAPPEDKVVDRRAAR